MASASALSNMSGLRAALVGAERDTLEIATTLTELKKALEIHTKSKVELKHVRQETSLTKRIDRIEKEIEGLQSELQAGLQPSAVRSERVQKLAAGKLVTIRATMAALRLELDDLKQNLGPIAAAAAAESEVAALRAEEIRRVQHTIGRLQPKFDRDVRYGVNQISSALEKMGRSSEHRPRFLPRPRSPARSRSRSPTNHRARARSRSRSPRASASTRRRSKSPKPCNNNNNNCRPNSPRGWGGATRRRHRKRKVTRRR